MMSTPANIIIVNLESDGCLWTGYDGYPNGIIPELLELIPLAKEKAKRNPDFSFSKILWLMLEEDYNWEVDWTGGWTADFSYKVDENGKIWWRDNYADDVGVWKDAELKEWE